MGQSLKEHQLDEDGLSLDWPSEYESKAASPLIYFTIARNVAAGNGISFDGLSPTNGFHPLWLLIITPFWWVVESSQTLPVHLSLTTGALFDLVTMAGIGYLALVLTRQIRIAGLVVLIYAWNPYNLAASVNGLETSVGAMLFVWSLAVYWCLRLLKQISWQQWLAIGALWSLLLLARTDYAVIMLPCGVDLLWGQRHQLKSCWVAALASLCLQTYPAQRLEVIMVADGDTLRPSSVGAHAKRGPRGRCHTHTA